MASTAATTANTKPGLPLDTIINFDEEFVQIIDGKSSATEKTRHGVNPANLQPKAKVPVATRDDLDRAVATAKRAFKTWSNTPYEERRSAVLAYADGVDALRKEFRDLLISEQGKPVSHPLQERKRAILRIV